MIKIRVRPLHHVRPAQAREYGVAAINRAVEGVTGETIVHLCFGYAALVKQKPDGYAFLPELER
jgi:5-methyltetrahydropteroyltriglutamate--homocysteine methyltransferase